MKELKWLLYALMGLVFMFVVACLGWWHGLETSRSERAKETESLRTVAADTPLGGAIVRRLREAGADEATSWLALKAVVEEVGAFDRFLAEEARASRSSPFTQPPEARCIVSPSLAQHVGPGSIRASGAEIDRSRAEYLEALAFHIAFAGAGRWQIHLLRWTRIPRWGSDPETAYGVHVTMEEPSARLVFQTPGILDLEQGHVFPLADMDARRRPFGTDAAWIEAGNVQWITTVDVNGLVPSPSWASRAHV